MTQHVVVLTFETEAQAMEVLHTLQHLHKEDIVDVADAVVVTSDQDGHLHVCQTVDAPPSHGAIMGGATVAGWFGFWIGLFTAGPIGAVVGGSVLGGAAAKLVQRLTDAGLDDAHISETAQRMSPGTAALYLLIRFKDHDSAIRELRPFAETIIEIDVPDEVRALIEDALRTEDVQPQ